MDSILLDVVLKLFCLRTQPHLMGDEFDGGEYLEATSTENALSDKVRLSQYQLKYVLLDLITGLCAMYF